MSPEQLRRHLLRAAATGDAIAAEAIVRRQGWRWLGGALRGLLASLGQHLRARLAHRRRRELPGR
jgi:hypothetical protein